MRLLYSMKVLVFQSCQQINEIMNLFLYLTLFLLVQNYQHIVIVVDKFGLATWHSDIPKAIYFLMGYIRQLSLFCNQVSFQHFFKRGLLLLVKAANFCTCQKSLLKQCWDK